MIENCEKERVRGERGPKERRAHARIGTARFLCINRAVAVVVAVVDVAVSVCPCADDRAETSAVHAGTSPELYGATLLGAVPHDESRSEATDCRNDCVPSSDVVCAPP